MSPNKSVNAAARREAIAARKCPVDHDTTGWGSFLWNVSRLVINNTTGKQKPDLYGRFSVVIDRMLEKTYETGLSTQALDTLAATIQSNTTVHPPGYGWHKLSGLWQDTLQQKLEMVLPTVPELTMLNLLWSLRSPKGDAKYALQAGTRTATSRCSTIGFGMQTFLEKTEMPRYRRQRALIRSHGPIGATASLELRQGTEFATNYLGLEVRREADGTTSSITHFAKVRSDIYQQNPSERVNLSMQIEDFPIADGRTIADVPPAMPGERIGCPILLTPKQMQNFWVVYTESAQTVGLI